MYFESTIEFCHGYASNIIFRKDSEFLWSEQCLQRAELLPHCDFHKILCREVVSEQKPRSERHGWETSFKEALLLRAEGAIRAFFVGHYLGDNTLNIYVRQ